MESKVFKLLHKGNLKKKHFADLQENTEGGGGGGGWMDGWMDESDLSGGIKGDVEVVFS